MAWEYERTGECFHKSFYKVNHVFTFMIKLQILFVRALITASKALCEVYMK